MVISLGKISLKSVPTDDRKDISMMHSLQFTSEDIMKEVMDQAYDKFRLDIENIQVIEDICRHCCGILYSDIVVLRFY